MTTSNTFRGGASIKWRLSSKFIAILVVGVIGATICNMLFGYQQAHKLRKEGVGATMRRTAEKLAGQIDFSLNIAIKLMTESAASAELQEALNQNVDRLLAKDDIGGERPDDVLKALASAHPGFRAIKVVDLNGKTITEFGDSKAADTVRDNWWDRTGLISRGKPVISKIYFSDNPVATAVIICVRIFPEQDMVFEGEIRAEYTFNHVTSPRPGLEKEIVAFLLTEKGSSRLHVVSPSYLASSRPSAFSEEDGNTSFEKGKWYEITLEQPGVFAIAGFSPLRGTFSSPSIEYEAGTLSIMAATPENDVIAPLNALFIKAFAFCGIMIAVVSFVGFMIAQRILTPIRMLQEGVQEIGQGNLEHRIDVRSGDEIESLAYEFNRMADRMQRTQEQLQRRGKELEQRVNQLRRLQAQLMQSERMAATGELAAQIAHEINNPLGIIKNYVGIAKMLMPDEDSNRENLKIVDQEINRIAGIVRRLLKFAKPGTEDIQSVQINQVLDELLALLRGQLFRRKIEVASDLAENLPEVSVSTDQMRQVFLNLIKNAEDAMPEGGKMTIRTRYQKGGVEIDIGDDGCGIPPADVKNIFEPFFTTKGVKGTGLGLSVSYGIIKNYNGEIRVDSEPGGGTTFTIQLPVVSDKVFQVIQQP